MSDSIRGRYLASEQAALDYCDELVDGAGNPLHIDRVVSVRGLERERDGFEHISEILMRLGEELHNGT